MDQSDSNTDLPTFDELFKQIKFNFWFFGIPNKNTVLIRFKCVFLFLIMIVSFEFAFLVSKCTPDNFLELTHSFPCACCGLWSIFKIIPIAAYRHKIFDLTDCLDELYSTISGNPKKCAVVKQEVFFVKKLLKYYFILNTTLVTVYNFSTLGFMWYGYRKTNVVKFSLPYPVILPFFWHSWGPWSILYAYQVFCGFTCVLFISTVDALYSALTSQLCYNFSVISNEIKNLDATNVDMLKTIVAKHQYVLKLCEDLEVIFTLPNLFNVLMGSLQICALGINITMGDWAHVPGSILFLVTVLLQILMMCAFGEKLIGESRTVSEAAWLCKWYEMDEKSKKIILIIMIRSQKPQKLTAYKFNVISYQSFTKIVSSSWSYFTILRTVYVPSTLNAE